MSKFYDGWIMVVWNKYVKENYKLDFGLMILYILLVIVVYVLFKYGYDVCLKVLKNVIVCFSE